MVVEDRFLPRAGIELAIAGKFQHHAGEGVWLAHGIDAENIGFLLGGAHDAVGYRGGEEHENTHQRHQQGKAGNVGRLAHLPIAAEYASGEAEAPGDKAEPGDHHQAQQQHQPRGVVHHIMAHLMAQHRQHFVMRALVQQVVIQENAGGAQKAGDIGRDAVGLARFIHQPDILRRDAIGAREREDVVFQRAVGQGGIVIEQGLDGDRRDHHRDHHHRDHQSRRP